MTTGRVIVVGSVNVDLVATVGRLPAPGETVTGATFARHPGGKGGNQATAAARLGAAVIFIGAVGGDALGTEARDALIAEGIDVSELQAADAPTGVALILVDVHGQNVIAVASGANAAVSSAIVEAALGRVGPRSADVITVSHEVPADAVLTALSAGRSAGATTILNPAPAIGVELDAIDWADVVVPNEGELAELFAVLDRSRSAETPRPPTDVVGQAAQLLAQSGGGASRTRSIIVTRGPRGAVLVRDVADWVDLPAADVDAVDTTGAGDTLVGALAAGLAEGRDLEDAARRAVAAASLSTTKPGARGGMPTRAELDAFVSSR